MGNRCIPNLVLIWLSGWERRFPDVLKRNLTMYYRYVDDTAARLRLREGLTLENIKARMEEVDQNVKVEAVPLVNGAKLPWLDIQFEEEMRMVDGALRRVLNWRHYRKSMAGRFVVPWNSAHPTYQKRDFISGELVRICRNSKYRRDVIPEVFDIVKRCADADYPVEFIKRGLRVGIARWKGILRQVRLGQRPRNRSRRWRLAHPKRVKIKGVPEGPPDSKFNAWIPVRKPPFKRNFQRAVHRSGLPIKTRERAGISIGQILCPSAFDCPKACRMQEGTCFLCNSAPDNPNIRRHCRTRFVVYEVECGHCNAKYCGQTKQPMRSRCYQHHSESNSERSAAQMAVAREDPDAPQPRVWRRVPSSRSR